LRRELLLALLSLSPFLAFSQEEKLIPGPGSTLTENKCKICHELQHIRRAELSPGEWADNIRNMKERGAPMTEAEMAGIHRYLSTYYNRDKPAPAPSPDTLAAGATGEDPAQQLLAAHGCTGCHALDARVVGPSFREVSRKYASDAQAKSRLALKVRNGSQGAWGNVPMPPNAHVPEPDARRLVDWILALP
jgi:cytochrome c551/c552